MTVVLVLLCMTVGAFELYAGRQSKRQADSFLKRIEELQIEVGRQQRAFADVGDQVAEELSTVKREVIPSIDSRLRRNAGEIDRLNGMLQQAGAYLQAQAARLHDLEKQKDVLATLRGRLADIETSVRERRDDAARTAESDAAPGIDEKVETALTRISELERGGDQILDLQRDLTRTLEDVEDVVTDLLKYTEGELDQAVTASLNGGAVTEATIPGRLGCPDRQLLDIIAEVYERCVRAQGMAVRFKTPESEGEPGRLRYFLTGRDLEELSGGFTALLISTGLDTAYGRERQAPADEAALQALLRTVHESPGTTVQIGPLVAVRSTGQLLCGVLSHGQSIDFESSGLLWEPAAAAVWLGRLPAHQYWDLTEWAARPTAEQDRTG